MSHFASSPRDLQTRQAYNSEDEEAGSNEKRAIFPAGLALLLPPLSAPAPAPAHSVTHTSPSSLFYISYSSLLLIDLLGVEKLLNTFFPTSVRQLDRLTQKCKTLEDR